MFEKLRNTELSWLLIPRDQEGNSGLPRISYERISSLDCLKLF